MPKIVKTTTRIYYHSHRYIPFLEHRNYGKFPLQEKDDYLFFDVPTPYAKKLVEGSPKMFSLKKATLDAIPFDKMSDDNLVDYAQSRDIKVMGKERAAIIGELIALQKKEHPEPKADALKEVKPKTVIPKKVEPIAEVPKKESLKSSHNLRK